MKGAGRTCRPLGNADVPDTPEGRLGLTIRKLRVSLTWSQSDLAAQMRDKGFQWQQTTVAKSESAGRPVRYSELVALAEIFMMTPYSLFTSLSEQENTIERGDKRRRLMQEKQHLVIRQRMLVDEIARLSDQTMQVRDQINAIQTKLDNT